MRAARFFICRQSHFGAQRPRAARPRRRFANAGNGTKALNVRETDADERAETEWKAPRLPLEWPLGGARFARTDLIVSAPRGIRMVT